jgi:hypothetical protein
MRVLEVLSVAHRFGAARVRQMGKRVLRISTSSMICAFSARMHHGTAIEVLSSAGERPT